MSKVLNISPFNYLLTMLVPLWYNSGVTERNDMPVIDYQPFKNHPELKGVFVGGCVERGDGSSFRAMAHAHYVNGKASDNWICVRSPKRLYNATGGASELMKHELAHILTNKGHTDPWRSKLKELGGKVDYWYTKEYNLCRRAGYRPRSLKEAKDCLRTIKRQNKVAA
jgi:hypothetical protein